MTVSSLAQEAHIRLMLQSKKKVSERSVIGSGSQMLVDTQKLVAPGEFGFLNHFQPFLITVQLLTY